MSKIYARTAINQARGAGQGAFPTWLLVCLFAPFLLSCASVRPVVKIGLIAPFEGLYRRTGYDALSAMRAALNESTASQIDLLPIALDDSNDPERSLRAVQKLLQDHQVRAVVGPLTPAAVTSVAPTLAQTTLLWLPPTGLTDRGFIMPATAPEALTQLLRAVAPIMRQQGAERLALVSWPATAPFALEEDLALPSRVITHVAEVQENDAVLWLGDAADGATFLTQLRQGQPHVPFWLGPQGEDPVFTAFTAIRTGVYWASWADSEYDQWAQTHTPSTLLAYQVYRATQHAISHLQGATGQPDRSWSVRLFTLRSDGASQPFVAK